jgi:hypothetical protein
VFVIVVQIVSVLLALVAISKSYVDFRARLESLSMFLFWVVTWAIIVAVALFPPIVDLLLRSWGRGGAGLGTFFGMGLVFLYFVVYRIYVKLERIEQNLTKAIQELALREDWLNRR